MAGSRISLPFLDSHPHPSGGRCVLSPFQGLVLLQKLSQGAVEGLWCCIALCLWAKTSLAITLSYPFLSVLVALCWALEMRVPAVLVDLL